MAKHELSMKKILFILILGIFYSHSINAQQKKSTEKKYVLVKTEAEWKAELTEIQYFVLRKSGTERAFTSSFNTNKEKGVYVCAACNTPLYLSKHKFDSGSGWPSFDRAIKKNVELDVDYKIGYARTELKCNTCGSHLGHSFKDGPKKTTGIRHCINGVALKFIPKK
jgi:peptide-methionine (R)-S-oxide reductase